MEGKDLLQVGFLRAVKLVASDLKVFVEEILDVLCDRGATKRISLGCDYPFEFEIRVD